MEKDKEYWIKWVKAAAIRAVKTMAQTALGMFTVGLAINDINWSQVASVAAVSGIYSLITSVAGLPELESENNHDNNGE